MAVACLVAMAAAFLGNDLRHAPGIQLAGRSVLPARVLKAEASLGVLAGAAPLPSAALRPCWRWPASCRLARASNATPP